MHKIKGLVDTLVYSLPDSYGLNKSNQLVDNIL